MTKSEFQQLPWLLFEHQVRELTGYSRATIAKLMDCGVLATVQPAGCVSRKVRKIQVAQLLGREDWLDSSRWANEAELMPEKAAVAWTGYAPNTLQNMVRARSLDLVRPAGLGGGKFRKEQVGELVGLAGNTQTQTRPKGVKLVQKGSNSTVGSGQKRGE